MLGYEGDYELRVETGRNSSRIEVGGNNELLCAHDVRVVKASLPDFAVSGVSADAGLLPGAEASFSWTVTNAGPGAVSNAWTESIYLSDDASAGNDLFLRSFRMTEGLASGASVVRSESFMLPDTLPASGSIWVVVVADSGDEVIEPLGELPNVGISASASSCS